MCASPSETVLPPPKRQKRLLQFAGVLMLCTGSLVSSYLYQANGTPYEYAKPGTRRHSRAEITLMKQEDLAHARRMREKWRAWAEAHQNLLRKMYRRKGDAATLQAFVNAVPGMVIHDPARNPSLEGMQVTAEDLGLAVTGARPFGPEESETRRNRLFTWLPFSERVMKLSCKLVVDESPELPDRCE